MLILKFDNLEVRNKIFSVYNEKFINNYGEKDVLCFYFEKIDKKTIFKIEKEYRSQNKIYIINRSIARYFFSYIHYPSSSYILKSEVESQFINCYNATYSDGTYISLFFKNIIKISNTDDLLTIRDLDVIELLAKGYTYKDIANITNLQYGTIRNYVSKVLDITDCKNKTELALQFQKIFCDCK
ncbi:MAG: response regulator transcription factor [Bacilli bacterium]